MVYLCNVEIQKGGQMISHVENVGVSEKLLGYDGIHCHFGSARIHEVERLMVTV